MGEASREVVDALRGQSIFQGLAEGDLERVAEVATIQEFEKESRIIEGQSMRKDLYVILDGKVVVEVESSTPGAMMELSSIDAGEILGELSLIDDAPRSATVRCVVDTRVVQIPGPQLLSLFEQDYRLGYQVLRNLARVICTRIRKTNRRLLNSMRWKLV